MVVEGCWCLFKLLFGGTRSFKPIHPSSPSPAQPALPQYQANWPWSEKCRSSSPAQRAFVSCVMFSQAFQVDHSNKGFCLFLLFKFVGKTNLCSSQDLTKQGFFGVVSCSSNISVSVSKATLLEIATPRVLVYLKSFWDTWGVLTHGHLSGKLWHDSIFNTSGLMLGVMNGAQFQPGSQSSNLRQRALLPPLSLKRWKTSIFC